MSTTHLPGDPWIMAFSWADHDARLRDLLIHDLLPRLGTVRRHQIHTWDWEMDALIGLSLDSSIRRNFERSHIVLQLISPAFQTRPYIQDVESVIATEKIRVPVGLENTPLDDDRVIRLRSTRGTRRWFGQCTTPALRAAFADEVVNRLIQRLDFEDGAA